jgi:hypothetical protein
MTEFSEATTGSTGISVDDLPQLMREMFTQCVEDARAQVEPLEDLARFVDALWQHVDAAFGLTRREWPADAPKPWPALVDERRGLAEAVLEGRLDVGDLSA